MRRNVVLMSAVITILIGFTIAYPKMTSATEKIPLLVLPGAGQAGPKNISYVVKINDSQVPKAAKTYRVVSKDLTMKAMSDMAQTLGFDTLAEDNGARILFKDGKRFLRFEKSSGVIDLTDGGRYDNLDQSGNLPDDSQAEFIARAFAQSLDLLDSSFVFAGITVDTVDTANGTIPVDKTVHFYRQLDGKPVLGVSRVVISIGKDGKVTGFKKLYRDVESLGDRPLRNVSTALEDVRKNVGSGNIDPAATSADIETVSIAYWEDPTPSIQPYLQPVYVFSGKAQVNGVEKPFQHVVPALEK